MEEDGEDEEAKLKADRRAQVQALESKLVKVRRAKKAFQDEEDPDALGDLLKVHEQAEQDLESKLRQARSQYQELRPAEVKLQQAERDLEATKHKLDNTKDEIQQVEELIAKQQARLHRLQEQQELQVAKLSRLEAAIKEHHASIGGGKSGGAPGDSPPPSPTTLSPQDLSQCPAFVQLQQAYERMQGELREALAALATAKPAAKREREDPQVTDDDDASPAPKR
jgi:DNA repair exonuclease SbcCD ATPase subunit